MRDLRGDARLVRPGVTTWAAGSRSRIATAPVFLCWLRAGAAGWAGRATVGKAVGAPIAWGAGGLITGLIYPTATLRFSLSP